MRKNLSKGKYRYITAPDLNTSSSEMDFIVKTFGKGSATRTSAGIKHGSGLTGYGIALVALREIKKLNNMNKKLQYKIAKLMHDEYENYSRKVGWKTQKKCQTLFDELPPANKEVMLYVAGSIIMALKKLNK